MVAGMQEPYAHLDAGQLLGQALVGAVAEGQVPDGLAAQVEAVGLRVLRRVAVGGRGGRRRPSLPP